MAVAAREEQEETEVLEVTGPDHSTQTGRIFLRVPAPEPGLGTVQVVAEVVEAQEGSDLMVGPAVEEAVVA